VAAGRGDRLHGRLRHRLLALHRRPARRPRSEAAGAGLSALLSIQDLRVSFRIGKEDGVIRRVEAVKGVSFEVPENTTVALVGESGSGKSVTAMSILNLLPDNAERSGAITFQGKDLLAAPLAELQALRGRAIACVFQDPMSSLNPVFTVGQQIREPLAPRSCSPRLACPSPSAGWPPIRTSSRAASSSA
jgi:ABC-type glutathione transport system ATPase component